MNVGYFTSFTLFLALNDADFSNRFLRPPDAPLDTGVLSLAAYFKFWSAVYAAVTALVWAYRELPRSRPLRRAVRPSAALRCSVCLQTLSEQAGLTENCLGRCRNVPAMLLRAG